MLIVLDATIQPYKSREREMAVGHCEKIKEYLKRNKTILLCDRGYPSYNLLGYLYENHFKFAMRIKEQFTKMRTPGKQDGEVYLKCGRKMRTLRTIEVKLSEETTEYLITNLTKEEMEAESFKELYFLRWGVESKYQANRSYITGCINNKVEKIMVRKVNIQMEIEQLIYRQMKYNKIR